MATISERIVEGMELRHLRQADIIERTGINKGALSSYIAGRYKPKQNNIYLLAKALDVNEAWLMGADVPKERVYTNSQEPSLSSSSGASCSLRLDENQLLSYYNKLNHIGMGKAMEYVQDLSEQPKYIEPEEAGVEEPVKKRKT